MVDKFILWLLSKLFAHGVVITRSLYKRERMSHDNGTTATGKVTIFDKLDFPKHDFFKAGTIFPCRLRLASVSYPDDAVTQVRGASIKFQDSRFESPLDIELNTGTTSLFWTARNFVEFASHKKMTNGLAFSAFYDKYPQGLEAAKDGLRKYPESFTQLYFHSQCAQYFIGLDHVKRYVKFRLVPENKGPETGLIPRMELENRWVETVAPNEKLSPNYLKREFAQRIKNTSVKFILQLQLHTPTENQSDEIFNCNVAWDEKTHPFHDVALVEVDHLLSLDENNMMIFAVSNTPKSLGIIESKSIDDYNSVNYMRTQAGIAKKSRLFAYKIWGMPKPVPERS